VKKEDLVTLLNTIFIPLGFKKKGNNWVINNDVLVKVVNLQKSNFSNRYYLNYGFIIKQLSLTTTEHVSYRLFRQKIDNQTSITDLLDLDFPMDLQTRLSDLHQLIMDKIVVKLHDINDEPSLLKEILLLPTLNTIPLIVKKHFNIAY
jgi:hypothetical protein